MLIASISQLVPLRNTLKNINPRLANLMTEACGSDEWVSNLACLKMLESHADDGAFLQRWRSVKTAAKQDLANWLARATGVQLDPQTLFDVKAKRIREYKRQHLNVLHILTLYQRMKANPNLELTPRTFIFHGKTAPRYFMAKLIIKLINSAGEVVN
jgi:starch phosphorylase